MSAYRNEGSEYTTDPQGKWKVGDLVKTFEGAWSTSVIAGFTRYSATTEWEAHLCRPYAYASRFGRSIYMAHEEHTARLESIRPAEVSDRTGEVCNMRLSPV